MSRNLIVCFDGTNNQFGAHDTNVVRLVQALERFGERQLVYYDPGVGTLPEPGLLAQVASRVSELVGLAFGVGLVGQIERAYAFLMRNWQPGDRVFLFGFSRGAYTARALDFYVGQLGMVERQRITPSAGVTEIVLGFDKNPGTPGILLMHKAERTAP